MRLQSKHEEMLTLNQKGLTFQQHNLATTTTTGKGNDGINIEYYLIQNPMFIGYE